MLWKTRQNSRNPVLNKGRRIYYVTTWIVYPVRFYPTVYASRVFLLEDPGQQRESDHCQLNRLFCSCARCYLPSELRARLIFQCPIIREIPETLNSKHGGAIDDGWRRGEGDRNGTDKVKICIDGERESRNGWIIDPVMRMMMMCVPARLFFSFQRSFKLCRLSRCCCCCCCSDVCHISSHFTVNPSLKNNNKERKIEKYVDNRYSHDTNASPCVPTCPTNPTRERDTKPDMYTRRSDPAWIFPPSVLSVFGFLSLFLSQRREKEGMKTSTKKEWGKD